MSGSNPSGSVGAEAGRPKSRRRGRTLATAGAVLVVSIGVGLLATEIGDSSLEPVDFTDSALRSPQSGPARTGIPAVGADEGGGAAPVTDAGGEPGSAEPGGTAPPPQAVPDTGPDGSSADEPPPDPGSDPVPDGSPGGQTDGGGGTAPPPPGTPPPDPPAVPPAKDPPTTTPPSGTPVPPTIPPPGRHYARSVAPASRASRSPFRRGR